MAAAVRPVEDIRSELVMLAENELIGTLHLRVLTGAECDQHLKIGSAVLVYATPLGERIQIPHRAQVRIGSWWTGTVTQSGKLLDDWFYLVLWAKPVR